MTIYTGPDGNIVTGKDRITDVVLDRLLTEPGSRPLFPAFGAGIGAYVDAPGNLVIQDPNLGVVIRGALADAPEFTVDTVSVTLYLGQVTAIITGTTTDDILPFTMNFPIA